MNVSLLQRPLGICRAIKDIVKDKEKPQRAQLDTVMGDVVLMMGERHRAHL